MTLFFLILLIFLVVIGPAFEFRRFQALKQGISRNPGCRMRYYIQSLWALWVPAVYFLVVALFYYELTPRDLGLEFYLNPHSTLAVIAGLLTIGLLVAVVVSFLVGIFRPSFHDRMRQDIREGAEITFLIPRSARERMTWVLVAISTGICEELLYRVFLMTYLPHILHVQFVLVPLILSSLIYGLSHIHQGVVGVLRTSAVGLGFGLLYFAFSSILPVMLLHAAIDLMAAGIQVEETAKARR